MSKGDLHDKATWLAMARNDGYMDGYRAGLEAARLKCNAPAERIGWGEYTGNYDDSYENGYNDAAFDIDAAISALAKEA